MRSTVKDGLSDKPIMIRIEGDIFYDEHASQDLQLAQSYEEHVINIHQQNMSGPWDTIVGFTAARIR